MSNGQISFKGAKEDIEAAKKILNSEEIRAILNFTALSALYAKGFSAVFDFVTGQGPMTIENPTAAQLDEIKKVGAKKVVVYK